MNNALEVIDVGDHYIMFSTISGTVKSDKSVHVFVTDNPEQATEDYIKMMDKQKPSPLRYC